MKCFFKIQDVVKLLSFSFIGPRSLLRISDNDKPESLACDEDAERVECGLKMSVLMPDIISICFNQPATVNLAIALRGFMKLTNN